MQLVQWHTAPPKLPIYKEYSKITLSAPYAQATPELRTRLDEFVSFLTEKGYVPQESYTELTYRYRREYGEKPPPFISHITLFVRVASVLELQAAVSAGWTWDRIVPNVPGPDCNGIPGNLWVPHTYATQEQGYLLPVRDPSHNYGVTRIQKRGLGTVSEMYACCGKDLSHPGCWKGETKYELVPYDMAPSFSNGTIWQLVANEDWVEIRRIWLTEDPIVGTMFLHEEFYKKLDSQIRAIKPQLADDIVRVYQELRQDKLEEDDPSKVALNPWSKLTVQGMLVLKQLLQLQEKYNRIQCHASAYDIFAVERGEQVLNLEENHWAKLLKLRPVSFREAIEDAQKTQQDLQVDIGDYIDELEIMRDLYITDVRLLGQMISQISGTHSQYVLGAEEVAETLGQYEALHDSESFGYAFRRNFNATKGNPTLDPGIQAYDLRARVRAIPVDEYRERARLILSVQDMKYQQSIPQLDFIAEYRSPAESQWVQDARQYTPELYNVYQTRKSALDADMQQVYETAVLLTQLPATEDRGPFLRETQRLEQEWNKVKAILDETEIERAKALGTMTWDTFDKTQLPRNIVQAIETADRYPELTPAKESLKIDLMTAVINGSRLPEYQQFILNVNRKVAEERADTKAVTYEDAKVLKISNDNLEQILLLAEQAIQQAFDSGNATLVHGLKRQYIVLAQLDTQATPNDIQSLASAAEGVMVELTRLLNVVKVEIVPRTIKRLDNRVSIQPGREVLSTSALIWNANSCWIDAPLTALFSLPETSLEDIIRSRDALIVKETCPKPQEFYESIINDIVYLQSHELPDGPRQCSSIEFFQDCTKYKAERGAFNKLDLTIENLISAFELQESFMRYTMGPETDYSLAQVLQVDYARLPSDIAWGYKEDVLEFLLNGTFVLFSVVRSKPEHFVAGVREPTQPEKWWHVDKQVRQETNLDNLRLNDSVQRERLVAAFYMRTDNWTRIQSKARNGIPPLLQAAMDRNVNAFEDAVNDRSVKAEIIVGLNKLDAFRSIDREALLLEQVIKREPRDVQAILNAFPVSDQVQENLRELGLFE